MKKSIMRVPFNRKLRSYLLDQGYTHVYNKGIESYEKDGTKDDEDNKYILTPLRPGDPAFSDAAMSERIEDINSTDVCDMAEDDMFINFLLEIPVGEYDIFIEN